VDKAGDTIDFLFRARRDKAAARRNLEKAIDQNGAPETVIVDKSGASLAAMQSINAERETPIKVALLNKENIEQSTPMFATFQTFTDTGMPRLVIRFSADTLIHAPVFCCGSARAFMALPKMRL
jgi:transposase-like protein